MGLFWKSFLGRNSSLDLPAFLFSNSLPYGLEDSKELRPLIRRVLGEEALNSWAFGFSLNGLFEASLRAVEGLLALLSWDIIEYEIEVYYAIIIRRNPQNGVRPLCYNHDLGSRPWVPSGCGDSGSNQPREPNTP